ncbi:hypothetical protein [Flavobacterium sp. GCM10027622]|uniref:hypothetical protein n=1 Tax=unclassified Flavobacterium TaxID=196869 RepID=UPI0036100E46
MKTLFSILFLFLFTVQDNFTFTSENQKVTLKIDGGTRHLTWGKKSVLTLKVANIETEKMSVSAPGIRIIKSANPKEEINLEITPEKSAVVKDTLKLNFRFRNQANNFIYHFFKIAINE